MKELIGYLCRVDFNLPAREWPFPGYPAWLVVHDVDGTMVKMGSEYADPDEYKWVSVHIIKTIEAVRKMEDTKTWPWWRFWK